MVASGPSTSALATVALPGPMELSLAAVAERFGEGRGTIGPSNGDSTVAAGSGYGRIELRVSEDGHGHRQRDDQAEQKACRCAMACEVGYPRAQCTKGPLNAPSTGPCRAARGNRAPRARPGFGARATILSNRPTRGRRRRTPRSRVPTSVPEVVFSDQRLANGLRVIVAEDHLAPVVAVNVWYDVGSKHEVPGKTGFAHLFEHVMFQGSRHVAKAEHVALIQAAGGTMNGSTWLDRTNYFETLPAHQLELGLWLEADRMATLLDALSQENLDNQREVVKNEKRWSYDNRPYGSWQEKLQAHLFPPEHPYHHSTIGSMDDLDAASLEDVSAFFRTYYAPNNAVLSVVGDVETADVARRGGALLRPDPGQSRRSRRSATCRCRRRSAGSAAKPCSIACRCRGSTSGSAPRSLAIHGWTRSTWPVRSWPAARAAGSTGAWSARSGLPRTSRCSPSGSSAERRSAPAG